MRETSTKPSINPKQTWLFWRLERLGGGGGGGAIMAPFEISAVGNAIAAKICIMVVCDVIYKMVFKIFQNIFILFYIN